MKARGPNNFKKRMDIVRCKIVNLKTRDWRLAAGLYYQNTARNPN